ncbi:hypothetical protein ATO00_02845 [Loigolactobacillus coryniformis subsp. coryniformis]|nr:hypothetical protein ATO00_02845 [Loigolactobacillus coryniformis subsp. coryniformis]
MPTHQQTLAELVSGQIYVAIVDFQIEPQFDTDQYSARQGDRIEIRGIFPNGAMVYNLNAAAGFLYRGGGPVNSLWPKRYKQQSSRR